MPKVRRKKRLSNKKWWVVNLIGKGDKREFHLKWRDWRYLRCSVHSTVSWVMCQEIRIKVYWTDFPSILLWPVTGDGINNEHQYMCMQTDTKHAHISNNHSLEWMSLFIVCATLLSQLKVQLSSVSTLPSIVGSLVSGVQVNIYVGFISL